jgi:hypothetical protein
MSWPHRYAPLMKSFPDTFLALAELLCNGADRQTIVEIQLDGSINLVGRHGLLAHGDAVVRQQLEYATLRDAEPATKTVGRLARSIGGDQFGDDVGGEATVQPTLYGNAISNGRWVFWCRFDAVYQMT